MKIKIKEKFLDPSGNNPGLFVVLMMSSIIVGAIEAAWLFVLFYKFIYWEHLDWHFVRYSMTMMALLSVYLLIFYNIKIHEK